LTRWPAPFCCNYANRFDRAAFKRRRPETAAIYKPANPPLTAPFAGLIPSVSSTCERRLGGSGALVGFVAAQQQSRGAGGQLAGAQGILVILDIHPNDHDHRRR